MLSTRLASLSLSAATGDAASSIHSLPRPLLSLILLLVPVDTRLRCSEVSRAWRALLADTVFWERLGFYDMARQRFSEALFVAAAAKAGGQLRELDVREKFACQPSYLTDATLLAAVAANSRTLQRLRLCCGDDGEVPRDTVAELCVAAPGLQNLQTKVSRLPTEARALFRREPPFGALNMCGLTVDFGDFEDDENTLLQFVADLQLHGANVDELKLSFASIFGRAAWEALADAAHLNPPCETGCIDYHARPVVCARPGALVARGEHFSAISFFFSERRDFGCRK